MANLSFLKEFRKKVEKMTNVSTTFQPPKRWYTTGNYAINRILSGSYIRGYPAGRVTAFAGPSAAGKSFLACNAIREAQKEGAFVLVIDSENALDPTFMSKIGVDLSADKLQYLQVVTIQDVTEVLSNFLSGYEKEYGRYNKDAPDVVVFLDSLGNLLTAGEDEKFDKGIQTGDQGQSAKLKKHLLRTSVSRLARLDIPLVFTDQVYPQDVMLGDGPWAITNGVKYSTSQIALITKLNLKDGTDFIGIRMRVESYKSRFAKSKSKTEVEVPYSSGMNKFSGVVELLETDGIVTKEGYSVTATINGEVLKFKESTLTDEIWNKLIQHPLIRKMEQDFEDADAATEEAMSLQTAEEESDSE
jgi:recombination protein RecA